MIGSLQQHPLDFASNREMYTTIILSFPSEIWHLFRRKTTTFPPPHPAIEAVVNLDGGFCKSETSKLLPPWKLEKQPFEDTSPIKNGDVPASHF